MRNNNHILSESVQAKKDRSTEAMLQVIKTLIALFKETLKEIICTVSLRLKDTNEMTLNQKRIIK